MFRRRRQTDEQEWQIEDRPAQLRRVLAIPGPHDQQIGHHRTYEGNRDASRVGQAVVGQAVTPPAAAPTRPTGRVLRLAKVQTPPEEIVAPAARKRVARG